jgi:hypothetical protein
LTYTLTCVDCLEVQHIAEEGMVGLGIAAVQEKMGSVDHDGRDFNSSNVDPPIELRG